MCLNVVPRSLMTKRLPTELVNVETTDTANLDEQGIVNDTILSIFLKTLKDRAVLIVVK